jgi:CTP:molybdopterin cytidylyltransferase MocA
MRPLPAILVLAAGESSRMRGADKLLEGVDGTPLVLRAVRAACAVSPEVVVTLPPGSPRRAWLGDTPARLVEVTDRAMSASIRAGLSHITRRAVLIHLADMPEIGAAELQSLAEAWTRGDGDILQAATATGEPGQPVIFGARHYTALEGLTGDMGAKPILADNAVDRHPLPGRAARIDLDTPEDWAAWRARTGR